MQSGREDTLEERYAIKLCFKLGKNATETYGMLQTAFGASCMNRASVFEWHKRLKEGRLSVRGDERCGRSKEVRTPELIGQIKNFMDKDRRVSIETISLMTVWELYTQLFARKWRCGRFAWSLSQGCSEKIRKKGVVMTAARWSCWSIQTPQFLMLWWPAMKVKSTAMTQRPRDRVPSGSMLGLPDPRRPDRANPPTNFWWSLFLTALVWSTCTGFPLSVSKGYNIEVLREFRKRFGGKRPVLFKSDQWHFQQDNAPVHNSILVTDYLTKMGIKIVPHRPYSPVIAPRDFWLYPKFMENHRGSHYETIEEMKEAVTKVIDTLTQDDFHGGLPEVVGMVQQVHWSWRRLLRRGLEFHVCTIA